MPVPMIFAITIPQAVKKPTVTGGWVESGALMSANLVIVGRQWHLPEQLANQWMVEFVRLSDPALRAILDQDEKDPLPGNDDSTRSVS